MNIGLLACGIISSLLGIVHWYFLIEKLFIVPDDAENMEMEETKQN